MTRRQFLQCLAGTTALSATGGVYGTLFEPFRVVIERITVPFDDLPPAFEGFRIALLSDFHLQPFTTLGQIEQAVAAANRLDPDLIALTGDFVDETATAIDELAPVLSGLHAPSGTFAVLGNHDLWTNGKMVRRGLERQGIPVLRNSGIPLTRHGQTLYFAGVDDVWAGRPDLDRALSGNLRGHPTVLLAHEPDYADTAALDRRVRLQLSGHSHGGQVCFPFVGPLRLPSWGRKYPAGLYAVKKMHVYTTRGIGCGGLPVRLNCPPEVTLLTLQSARPARLET